MSDLKLIPIRNKAVNQSTEGTTLILALNENQYTCSQEEAITWALADGISTLKSIANNIARANNLVETDSTKIESIALASCRELEKLGLIDLVQQEPIFLPLDTSEFSHFASTRGGVYAVNQQHFQRVAYGMFFGLCFDTEQNLIAFDFPHLSSSLWREPFSSAKKKNTDEGVLRQYKISNGLIQTETQLPHKVGNNCHYVIREGENIYAVDTEQQRITMVKPNGNVVWNPVFNKNDYHHINAVCKTDDKWLVMKSMISKSNNYSAFGVFDENWKLLSEVDLPGQRSHDFLPCNTDPEAELEFWYCDSKNLQIRHYPSHEIIKIPPHMQESMTVRGLSETETHWVVGGGQYGQYYSYSPKSKYRGSVSFVNKQTQKTEYQLHIPEAPCVIVQNPWYHQGA